VFLLNSRNPCFPATPIGLGGKPPHPQRCPFSRSYGTRLPSSLARVLSNALVYSTHLPESVCGTGTRLARYEAFLGSLGSTSSAGPCGLASSSPLSVWNGKVDLPLFPAYRLEPGHPTPGWPTLLRPPFTQTLTRWYGNINPLCITYAFRPRLSPRLTLGGLTLPRKP